MSITTDRPAALTDKPDPVRSPWGWIPSLYFAQGIPNVLVTTVSLVMFSKMGVPNTEIAFWTSLLAFPWVFKPLWGPLVDLYWTKRKWVVLMQLLLAGAFAGVAVSLQGPGEWWWWGSLAFLGIAAVFSATHDIAADGYYMVALDERKQALFVGIRSTFFRVAMITGQGVLVIIAGIILARTGPAPVILEVQAAPKGIASPPLPAAPNSGFVRFDPPAVSFESGTTVPVSVTLSEQPETTKAVTINRKYASALGMFFPVGAEQLVKVSKGDRMEFGPDNWNVPQQIVAEADLKLKEPAKARFEAAAGDFELTWTYCFGAIAGMFLLLSLFHTLAMPKVRADGNIDVQNRPPFLRALTGVLPIIIAPIAIYVGLFYGLLYFVEKAAAQPGFEALNSLSKFVTNALVIGLVWLLFRSAFVRGSLFSGFQGASRRSGIPFAEVFISFFRKPGVGRMIAFLLLYRFGEGLLVKMAAPFLLKPREGGGLGLTQAEYGLAYGTVGVMTMVAGGILGGLVVAKWGLKRWLLPMCIALNTPHLLYVYLAWARPEDFLTILACVATETFGYGFGFAAYMMYMLYIAGEGSHKTSHFAITTGFMSLSMLIPGMMSGALQEATSYLTFFIIVCFMAIPGLLMLPIIPLDPEFGRRSKQA